MSIFKKIGRGIKKATKAVGKGVGNAAKFTAKNPLKVIAPIAALAGTVLTAGALAPGLAPALAATKVGKSVFGRMVTKTLSSGTVVRNKIVNTLKKNGKKATAEEVKIVEDGLQEEILRQKGFKLPVDKVSKTGTEARATLKAISDQLTDNQVDFRNTLVTEGKRNILDVLTGNEDGEMKPEEVEEQVKAIEKKQNKASFIPESVLNFLKQPLVLLIMIGGAIYYFTRPKK